MDGDRDWDAASARFARRALDEGEPTAWFERLYAAGARDEIDMPWDRAEPNPLLTAWLPTLGPGAGRSAVVVGCGLGADAEYVAARGFITTAFDISATAVRVAADRHPGTAVRYRTADLLALPGDWRHTFDLVVEIITIQALPVDVRGAAIGEVASLVAPGGTALVVENVRRDGEPLPERPPWPFSRQEIDSFTGYGLRAVSVEKGSRWRAVFTAPPS